MASVHPPQKTQLTWLPREIPICNTIACLPPEYLLQCTHTGVLYETNARAKCALSLLADHRCTAMKGASENGWTTPGSLNTLPLITRLRKRASAMHLRGDYSVGCPNPVREFGMILSVVVPYSHILPVPYLSNSPTEVEYFGLSRS